MPQMHLGLTPLHVRAWLPLLLGLITAACGGTLPAAPEITATPSAVFSPAPAQLETATATLAATPTSTLEPTRLPDPSPSPQPTSTRELPMVQIYYEEYAQFELISPAGFRVLIDVMDPGRLSSPPSAQDVLLTTHGHFDHFQQDFADSFPGEELRMRAGIIEGPDYLITGIPSAHNEGVAFFQSGGSNYIFLVEMGGLRIAHFGDIGQLQLTDSQLQMLAPLDIAIIQLANRFSDMNLQNRKAFGLIDQIGPRLLIPTHLDEDTVAHAAERFPAFYSLENPLPIRADQVSDETQLLLLGDSARRYAPVLGLDEW